MAGLQPVLNSQQLLKLKEHKYSCVNNSFLDKYLNPWWIWVELKVPVYIHANALTLVGLAVNLITTLVLVYYSPDAKISAPAWTYMLCCTGIFIYQTLDAIDGKHARRTNTSSPLGELFDHGCDALSTLFVVVGICITLKLGEEPLWTIFFVFSAIAIFYVAHWQTYVTGSLQFGVFDVTEIQYVCMMLHIVTFFGGTSIWKTEIFSTGIVLGDITHWIFAIGVVLNCWNKACIILAGGPGRNGSAVGNMSIIAPFFPLVLVLWQAYYLFNHSEEVEQNLLVYIFAFGMVLAKVTCRLVIAHMTQSEMRLFDTVYAVPLLMIARDYWNILKFIPEYWLLWACVIHATLDLCVYSVRTCLEIRDYLGIRVFSMEPLPTPGYLKTSASLQKRSAPSRINITRDGALRQPGSPRTRP
ncbi:cholinephosphotransferase 1-like [Paramacrobiotus metropolitanus]|uniref:cholinephosphotransferase 1-like n=1 Tax=Paramacrobiotus metropolitanus TaxID=2943436 RepID=UPI0024463954|nr:cholinephosphotransferase 1-like [Paramacrobiotus metropolitanus]